MANLVPDRYRQVALAESPVPLTEFPAYLHGREAYRRTRYIVARRGSDVGVVEVTKASDEPLFSPIVGAELIAPPAETVFVEDAPTDVGVPSQLAAAALRLAPHARCVVIQGRYEHVSFIRDPRPLRINVAEVVPPTPAKLLDQAQRVVDVADDLPPIELVPVLFDIAALARATPAEHYLFPCRSSGLNVGGAEVDFLDQRPPLAPWVLVAPERSEQIHQWFYGEPAAGIVDICPQNLSREIAGPTLTKCSLLEEDIEQDGDHVTVPWGASLAHVRTGLEMLVRIAAAAPVGAR
jgi:hypothetical protein